MVFYSWRPSVGNCRLIPFTANAAVTPEILGTPADARRPLFIVVHGLNPEEKQWRALAATFAEQGEVLRLRYHATLMSNADPNELARNIAMHIEDAVPADRSVRVVLIAHSMGAPLIRRALLLGRGQPWVERVHRVVLMAGISRGWDLSGEPPPGTIKVHRL